jgi:hypothetical protein
MAIIHTCDQGSAEWFARRLGIPTASEFDRIITAAKGDLSKSASKYAQALVIPTAAELATVLAFVPPTMAAILRLLAETGMRENEAVRLHRDAVDRERRQIVLLHTKSGRPRTLRWATPGGDAGLVLEHTRCRCAAATCSLTRTANPTPHSPPTTATRCGGLPRVRRTPAVHFAASGCMTCGTASLSRG